MNIYDFKVKKGNGKEILLEEYRGKVILIVNTASKCGLTPQFKGLEKIYEDYKNMGFIILGFPCDQFAKQEFDDNKKIVDFCQINYGVSFDMFDKVDVKGQNQSPLYAYLTKEKRGLFSKKIKWNFTKFLVDKNGKVIKRFSPTTKPNNIRAHIEKLLK